MERDQILHIADLARLSLEEEEIKMFEEQFSQILNYVKKIQELNVDEIEPTFHVIERENPLREDEVKDSLPISLFLPHAPDSEKNFFKVPPIIKK